MPATKSTRKHKKNNEDSSNAKRVNKKKMKHPQKISEAYFEKLLKEGKETDLMIEILVSMALSKNKKC